MATLELVSMNKVLVALAASLALTASVSAPADAWAEGHHGHGGGEHGGGGSRDGGSREGGGYRDGGRGGYRYGGERGGDRSGYSNGYRGDRGSDRGGPGRWDRGGGPPGPGADYRGQRWDDRRNNGYWMNSRWHYGPPPQDVYGRPGFSLGFSDWRRGGYLPPYYRGWSVDDYGRWGLRRPPYGYHWVRVGDDYLLVAIATGLIFDVVRP
jgi:Ni/Co efflux regulator RcnB